jgi:hypothetical protein
MGCAYVCVTARDVFENRVLISRKAESEREYGVSEVLWWEAAADTVYGGPARLLWRTLV